MKIRLIWSFIKGKWVQCLLYISVIILITVTALLILSFDIVKDTTQSGGAFYYRVRVYPDDTERGITEEVLHEMIKAPLIDGYNNQCLYKVKPLNFQNYVQGYEQNLETSAELEVNMDTMYSDIFMKKTARLIKGQLPSDQIMGAVIHKDLAVYNNFDLGDYLMFSLEKEGQTREIELQIIGIYELQSPVETKDTYVGGSDFTASPYARILTSFSSIEYRIDTYPLDYLDLLTADEENISGIISFIETAAGDWVNASEATDILFKLLNRSVEKSSKYITWMLGTLLVFCLVILILITVYNEHHNLYEMAIMISIGKSRKDILAWRLEQTFLQNLLGVGFTLTGFIAFSERVVSYWISIFTRNYREETISYQFTYESDAIASQIHISDINTTYFLAGVGILMLSLLVVGICNVFLLRQNAGAIIDRAA